MNKKSTINILWFLIGFGLFYFTRTTTFVPIAIALAPVFIIRFILISKPVKGILLTTLGFILVMQFNFVVPAKFDNEILFVFSFLRSFLLGIVLALPYIITRILLIRQKGFISTLIFPTAVVTIYFLDSVFGPFKGIIVFYAYSQFGNYPLMQMSSIGGIWILVFIISWFASVLNWLWHNDFKLKENIAGIAIFLSVLIGAYLYGGIKTSPFFYNYKNQTVRIAAAVFHPDKGTPNYGIDKILNERRFTPVQKRLNNIEEAVHQAAHVDAKIIAFQEFSLIIKEIETQMVLNELKRIAAENDIYICIGLVTMPELLPGKHEYFMGYMELDDEKEEGKNIAVFINNQGEIETIYQKHNLVFGEGTWVLEGPGKIPVVQTRYGKIGIAICRDMEFPDYMRQASKQKADIVIAPSYEAYQSLSITYSQMQRSIENGFSFIRPCGNGLTIAVDYNGKTLSEMNYFTSSSSVMLADVPTRRIMTVYSVIADSFAILCVSALLLFILYNIIGSRVKGLKVILKQKQK